MSDAIQDELAALAEVRKQSRQAERADCIREHVAIVRRNCKACKGEGELSREKSCDGGTVVLTVPCTVCTPIVEAIEKGGTA